MKIVFPIIGFLTTLLFCCGCDPVSEGSKESFGLPQSEEWEPFAITDRGKERRFVEPILISAFDGDFEDLDQLSKRLYQQKALHPDGSWAIDNFFSAFTEYDSYNQVDPAKWQPILEEKLQTWVEEYPKSFVARTAFSEFDRKLTQG